MVMIVLMHLYISMYMYVHIHNHIKQSSKNNNNDHKDCYCVCSSVSQTKLVKGQSFYFQFIIDNSLKTIKMNFQKNIKSTMNVTNMSNCSESFCVFLISLLISVQTSTNPWTVLHKRRQKNAKASSLSEKGPTSK